MNYYVYQSTPDFISSFKEHHGKYEMLYYHYHSTYEIFLMLDGMRYAFFTEGMYRLQKGDLLILKPYALHYNNNFESDYFKRYVMNFSEKALLPVLSPEECGKYLSWLDTGLIHLDDDNFKIIASLFRDINDSQVILSSLDQKRLSAKLLTFLDAVRRQPMLFKHSTGSDMIFSNEFADTLNYINRNFNTGITLDDAVKHAHMSKSYFCKLFKRETGNTFLEYLNNLRSAYAHKLLMNSSLAINRIAEEAGFSSTAHFERVFRQAHGMPPSAMRKQVYVC